MPKLNAFPSKPEKLVENRRVFGGKEVEFSIYDTFEVAQQVALKANNPLVCGMISGKKVIHAAGSDSFNFLPGETLLIPASKTVYIDFPEAKRNAPTQCLTVEIEPLKVSKIVDDLNERFPRLSEKDSWKYEASNGFLHFLNSDRLNQVMDQMVQCFTEDNPYKDLLIDLNTSRLVIHMLQNNSIKELMQLNRPESPMNVLIKYIREHLHRNISMQELQKVACVSKSTLYRAFQNELGCSPSAFIKMERMRKAAQLLKNGFSVTRCAFDLGFSSTAHFTRSFKAFFGLTPNSFRKEEVALAS